MIYAERLSYCMVYVDVCHCASAALVVYVSQASDIRLVFISHQFITVPFDLLMDACFPKAMKTSSGD